MVGVGFKTAPDASARTSDDGFQDRAAVEADYYADLGNVPSLCASAGRHAASVPVGQCGQMGRTA
jgi:hypothetical protein